MATPDVGDAGSDLSPPGARVGLGLALLHLAALSGFAIAQPTFDLLGRESTFFVAHRSSTGDLIWFSVFWAVVPAAVLATIVLAARLVWGRGWHRVHVALVAGLAALTVTPPVVRTLGLNLIPTVPVAAAGALAGWWLYRRQPRFRDLLTWASPAPIVFALIFLLFTPVRTLAFSGEPEVEGAHVREDTPVVMVVLDEFSLASLIQPDGDIDAERYPHLARLANTSTWYRNAMALSTATHLSLPTVLTGNLFDRDASPVIHDYPDNVFTMMGGSYRVNAYEAITQLCPQVVCEQPPAPGVSGFGSLLEDSGVAYLHLVLPDDAADRWLPSITGRWVGFGDEDVAIPTGAGVGSVRDPEAVEAENVEFLRQGDRTEPFDRWLEALDRPLRRSLNLVHLMLPHQPWRFLPDGTAYEGDNIDGLRENYRWTDDATTTTLGLQRYLLQAQLADRVVGRLMSHLEEIDEFDDTLLIVLADHGVAFEPGKSYRFRDGGTDGQLFPVPLFVKYPGQDAPEVDDRPAELTDVVPTIADVTGVVGGYEFAGRSLAQPHDPDRERVANTTLDQPLPDSYRDEMLEFATRVQQTFGPFDDPGALYGWASFGNLVGSSVEDHEVSTSSGARVAVADADAYRDVDPDTGTLPAFLRGEIRGVDTPVDLVVSVDGVIAAAGRSFEAGGTQRFGLMLDPRTLTGGEHTIEIFSASSDGQLTRLPTE